jgi:hypothetical protein
MLHRHLTHQRLTLAALDDIIENGTLADWQPVLARVRREPYGPVASRIAELLSERDYEESGALWRSFLDQARARTALAGTAGAFSSGHRDTAERHIATRPSVTTRFWPRRRAGERTQRLGTALAGLQRPHQTTCRHELIWRLPHCR